MATHGSIGEFQDTQESWQSYVERLQQYFIANDVDATEKQRAILLNIVGGKTYQLIRNLLGPAKPTERSFDEIVEPVRNHYQPVPSVIVQRFNFHTRACKSGENVSTYVSELRKLSEYCNFGDTLENMLRDRLVCGINDKRVQRRLLAEPGLTFAKALELAQAAETAESNAKQLEQVTQSTVMHAVSSGKKGGGSHRQTAAHREIIRCYRCGGKHISDRCYFKNSNCHHCGKTGHIAKVCRSKQRKSKPVGQAKQGPNSFQRTHHVESTGGAEVQDPYDEQLFNMPCKFSSPLMVTVQVNHAKLQMEVDTGASATIISYNTFKLRTYTGEELVVEGQLMVEVVYGDQQKELPLLVVAGRGPNLMG